MINPGAIPSIPGDMDTLAAHASQLSKTGGDFSRTGEQINHTWQGLSGVYRAPEAGQLFAATAPVQSVSASVGADIEAAGAALASYAAEVKQIKARLEALRTQAQAFVASVQGTHDWQSDSAKVDHNNQLIDAVSTEMAAFFDAQRRCANAINALYGGMQYQADNGDDTTAANEYGYTAQQLQDAAHQGANLPWGGDEKHDGGFWGDVGDFFGGMWDGAKQTVTGLGALIGYGDGHFSWSTAGTAWAGLGKFALAAGVYATPTGIVVDQAIGIPGFQRGELGQTLSTAGKGLVAWDEWSKDPSRAAGTATFNVITAVVGTKGAGAALKGAGTIAKASDVATVAKVGSVMTRGGELLTKMPTVSDLAGKAFGKLPMFRMPEISAPEMKIPEHVDIPHSPDIPEHHPGSIGEGLSHTPRLPDTHMPDAHVPAPRMPEHLPPSTTHTPEHADLPHTPDIHNGHPPESAGTPHDAPTPHEHGGSPQHDPAEHHDPSTGSHEHPSDGGPGHDHSEPKDTSPVGPHHVPPSDAEGRHHLPTATGIPYLPEHVHPETWNHATHLLQDKAHELGGEAGVQGSRVAGTHRPGSDIDFGIKVNEHKFDDLLQQRRQHVTPGSNRWETLRVAEERGRIHGGEAGLRQLRKQLERELGMEVDLSVIKSGGLFDQGPWIMFGE